MYLLAIDQVLDIIIACVIALMLIFFYFIKIKKPLVIITLSVILIAYLVSLYFNYILTSSVLLVSFIIFALIFTFVNIGSFKKMFADFTFLNHRKNDKKSIPSKINKDETYRLINESVKILAKTKTGALLTFEKKDDMSEIMKNGSIINSPISVELIQTIFYPGTRLHDGAIVIRGDIIVAASVYYTPTTKALTGKYGSRHRAAIGISDITDSVTVVVSEETGRISIAYQGKIIPIAQDEFIDEFITYMEK